MTDSTAPLPTSPTEPTSIYAIKDRPAVPVFAETRKTGVTKNYDSGKRYREIWGGKAHVSSPKDVEAIAVTGGGGVTGEEQTEEQRIERNKHADKLNEAYYDAITDHYQGGEYTTFSLGNSRLNRC